MTRRRFSRPLATTILFSALLAARFGAVAPSALGDELELLDGQVHVVRLTSVGPGGELSGQGVPAKLFAHDVRQLRRESSKPAPEVVPAPRRLQLDLVGGGHVRPHSAILRDEQFLARVGENIEWKWPLAAVAGVWLADQPAPSAYHANLAAAAPDVDRFLLRGERPGEWESLEGIIDSISAEQVQFTIGGETRTVDRKLVGGIVLASGGRPKSVAPQGELTLRDGARIPFRAWSLENGQLNFTPLNAAPLVIAWDHVERLDLRSPRLVYVSELEPTKVEEPVGIAPRRTWRRDRSVSGLPLRLNGRVYSRGLGVQAASRLEFDLGGGYEWFFAQVGLDDQTGHGGDCVMAVLGDSGQTLWKERVQGGETPRELRVDVRNQKRLTLVVEPGAELDLSDHANWADARLVRAAASKP